MTIFEYRGYDQERINELARYTRMSVEEKQAYNNANARRKEMEEREREVNLAIDRLLEMGLPITSVQRGVVTIDFNQMSVLA
jgi:hypothetical protein